MTLARLLAAALLMCSLCAFAQDQEEKSKEQESRPSAPPCAARSAVPCVAPDVALLFGRNSAVALPSDTLNVPSGQFRALLGKNALEQLAMRQLQLDGTDTTCYTIRSYVVARDSKDSDSTHPAGYSTCRPSDRYHVKTAELRVVVGDR
jgi:hypothetical protein